MQSNAGTYDSSSEMIDQIDNHLEYRYITPNEAVWRLLEYDLHDTDQSIGRPDAMLARMKTDSVSRFPTSYVVKKSFSLDNGQILPSTKVPMIKTLESSNNAIPPYRQPATIDTEENQNRYSLAKTSIEYSEAETTNRERVEKR